METMTDNKFILISEKRFKETVQDALAKLDPEPTTLLILSFFAAMITVDLFKEEPETEETEISHDIDN